MGTGVPFRAQSDQDTNLATYLLLEPRLRVNGDAPLFLLHEFTVWVGTVSFYFTFSIYA